MITTKAPGKIYIAGEYAVVENGYPAIIAAVNRFVTVDLKKTKETGLIKSKQYQNHQLRWRRVNSKMVVDNRDNPFQYIVSAINVTEEYVQSLNIPTQTYEINVNSTLDNGDGKKYGLGSSAAVTVATIKSLAKLYKLNLSKMELFKLAAISHFEVQGNGSLGDVASSVFGGVISYRSFDRQWLADFRKSVSIADLLKLEWPDLEIVPLKIPESLKFLVGWSGSPASTSNLIDKVELKKGKNRKVYQKFLSASDKCVCEIAKGFHAGNDELIMKNIKDNRKLLLKLSKLAHVEIETPALTKLINIADKFGGAAKTSGAGGGDCGIVLIKKNCNISNLVETWKNNKIKLLDISIYNY